MSLGPKVKTPTLTPLPPAPAVTASAEAEAARRDMEERMKRAAMNRAKSVLSLPTMMKPVQRTPKMLSETLG